MHHDANRTLLAISGNTSVVTWSTDNIVAIWLTELWSAVDEILKSIVTALQSRVSLPCLVPDVSKYSTLIFPLTDVQMREPMIRLTAVAQGEWTSSGGKEKFKNRTNQCVAKNKRSGCCKWPSHAVITVSECWFSVLIMRCGRKKVRLALVVCPKGVAKWKIWVCFWAFYRILLEIGLHLLCILVIKLRKTIRIPG